MPTAVGRWFRFRSIRATPMLCLVLMQIASSVVVHAQVAPMVFDIRAQPLSEALMIFGVQTGTIVMASSDLTSGKISKPVTGQFTRTDALTRMLQGTNLKFDKSADGTIVIVRSASIIKGIPDQ